MSAYPLKAFLEMGLKVTLNTDDPAIERTTLSREFRYMESLLNLTQEQKRLLLLNLSLIHIYRTDRCTDL